MIARLCIVLVLSLYCALASAQCASSFSCDESALSVGTPSDWITHKLFFFAYNLLDGTPSLSIEGARTALNYVNEKLRPGKIRFTLQFKYMNQSAFTSLSDMAKFQGGKKICKTESTGYCTPLAEWRKRGASEVFYQHPVVKFAVVTGPNIKSTSWAKFPNDAEDGAKGAMYWYVRQGGQTLIHELGHVLGLWHTFQGWSRSTCNCASLSANAISTVMKGDMAGGDSLTDTPPDPLSSTVLKHLRRTRANRAPLSGCNTTWIRTTNLPVYCDVTSVSSAPVALFPLVQNYNIMSYTRKSCATSRQSFTPLQIARMRCIIQNVFELSWSDQVLEAGAAACSASGACEDDEESVQYPIESVEARDFVGVLGAAYSFTLTEASSVADVSSLGNVYLLPVEQAGLDYELRASLDPFLMEKAFVDDSTFSVTFSRYANGVAVAKGRYVLAAVDESVEYTANAIQWSNQISLAAALCTVTSNNLHGVCRVEDDCAAVYGTKLDGSAAYSWLPSSNCVSSEYKCCMPTSVELSDLDDTFGVESVEEEDGEGDEGEGEGTDTSQSTPEPPLLDISHAGIAFAGAQITVSVSAAEELGTNMALLRAQIIGDSDVELETIAANHGEWASSGGEALPNSASAPLQLQIAILPTNIQSGEQYRLRLTVRDNDDAGEENFNSMPFYIYAAPCAEHDRQSGSCVPRSACAESAVLSAASWYCPDDAGDLICCGSSDAAIDGDYRQNGAQSEEESGIDQTLLIALIAGGVLLCCAFVGVVICCIIIAARRKAPRGQGRIEEFSSRRGHSMRREGASRRREASSYRRKRSQKQMNPINY